MRKILSQALGLLVLATVAPSLVRAAPTQKQIQSWQEELPALHEALTGGDWAGAERRAEELLAEIARTNPSTRLNELVSVAVLSQALAQVGKGDTDDGLWSWIAAQNLNPELRRARFSAYGAPGAFLEEHRLREEGAPPPGLAPVRVAAGMVPPQLPPDEELSEDWSRFELVVEADGSIRAPVLLARARPTTVLRMVEAFRELELTPATAGGEPVPVYWRPRPAVWVVNRSLLPVTEGTTLRGDSGGPLEDALASCEDRGDVVESAWIGPGPHGFTGPAPGMIETLRLKALRRGADTLVVDSHDDQAVSGRTFRCGKSWYPPHLSSRIAQGAGDVGSEG